MPIPRAGASPTRTQRRRRPLSGYGGRTTGGTRCGREGEEGGARSLEVESYVVRCRCMWLGGLFCVYSRNGACSVSILFFLFSSFFFPSQRFAKKSKFHSSSTAVPTFGFFGERGRGVVTPSPCFDDGRSVSTF